MADLPNTLKHKCTIDPSHFHNLHLYQTSITPKLDFVWTLEKDSEMDLGPSQTYFNRESHSIYDSILPPMEPQAVDVSNAAPDPAILFNGKEQVQPAQLYNKPQHQYTCTCTWTFPPGWFHCHHQSQQPTATHTCHYNTGSRYPLLLERKDQKIISRIPTWWNSWGATHTQG